MVIENRGTFARLGAVCDKLFEESFLQECLKSPLAGCTDAQAVSLLAVRRCFALEDLHFDALLMRILSPLRHIVRTVVVAERWCPIYDNKDGFWHRFLRAIGIRRGAERQIAGVACKPNSIG